MLLRMLWLWSFAKSMLRKCGAAFGDETTVPKRALRHLRGSSGLHRTHRSVAVSRALALVQVEPLNHGFDGAVSL